MTGAHTTQHCKGNVTGEREQSPGEHRAGSTIHSTASLKIKNTPLLSSPGISIVAFMILCGKICLHVAPVKALSFRQRRDLALLIHLCSLRRGPKSGTEEMLNECLLNEKAFSRQKSEPALQTERPV